MPDTLFDYYYSGTAGSNADVHVFPAPMTAVFIRNDGSASIFVVFTNSTSRKQREIKPGEAFNWGLSYGLEGCTVSCLTSSSYRIDCIR